MLRRALPPLVLLALLVALTVTAARGDTLYLKNGSKFEGKITRETATHIFIKIPGGGELPIKKSAIKKIERGKSVFDEYDERKAALESDDAEGHYELGIWCKEVKLRKEARKEFQAAVKADPDHAGARTELGFVHYEYEWITKKRYKEIMAEIEKREGELIAALELGDPYKDEGAHFQIGTPKGDWTKDADEGSAVTFTGPELGKAPVMLRLELTPEDTTLAENIDEFGKKIFESLKEDYEDFAKVGEPAGAKMAGTDGKLFTSKYKRDDLTPETIAMERQDVVAKTAHGYLQLTLECREGYAEKLKAFFYKVRASVKIVEPAAAAAGGGGGGPASTLERSYTLTMPDETYAEREGIPVNFKFGDHNMRYPPNCSYVGNSTNPVFIVVREGLQSESNVDCTSLDTLRDGLVTFTSVKNFIQPTGSSTSRKVGGQDATWGTLRILGGQIGSGYYSVFMKGDRYYQIVFLNIGNRMGDQYARPEFQKFLDGFKFK